MAKIFISWSPLIQKSLYNCLGRIKSSFLITSLQESLVTADFVIVIFYGTEARESFEFFIHLNVELCFCLVEKKFFCDKLWTCYLEITIIYKKIISISIVLE